ncbi:MAG TPA: APC family permease [Steroidobacteraceae bacterium]|jgi:amino acid transporter|nr:APC family permease [Steroidobacteraceae bacterium]
MPENSAGSTSLRRSIGPSGFFTIAFGSVVGSGWVIVLGEWLRAAGPGGSIVGFALGGAVMILVATCYGELAARLPRAGGEFVYALNILGPGYAFALAWFLTLFFAAFMAFEGIALGWIVGTLLPQAQGPVLYSVLGFPVTVGALSLGLLFSAVFALLNYVGTRAAISFQRIVTFGFIALVIGLVVLAVCLGSPANARPFFPSDTGRHWEIGAFWVFSSTAVFLNGFQSAAYAIEERTRSTSVGAVVVAMILGVVAAVIFYCSIIYAVSGATPWRDTVAANLPAAFAFGKLTSSGILGRIVLIGAAFSLLKSWNAYVLSAARLVFALAREGYLPAALARVHPRFGTPSNAILAMLLLNVIGVACGRRAIVPIVDMSAICTTCCFVICLIALLKVRRNGAIYAGFRVPGGAPIIYLALAGVIVMAVVAVYQPSAHTASGIPVEWVLLITWSLLGIAAWLKTRAIIGSRVQSSARTE